MSYDWLIIPFLLIIFGNIAYLLMRRQRRKNMSTLKVGPRSVERIMDSMNRSEDQGGVQREEG